MLSLASSTPRFYQERSSNPIENRTICMSVYTSVIVHPANPAFQPSEGFIKELLEFFGVSKIEIASGSQPDDDDEDVFFLQNISLDESFSAMRDNTPARTHLSLPHEGFLRVFSDAVSASIPKEVAGDFLPWDTGITIGQWEAQDYDTDAVLASGSFCITKSGNGCPPSLAAYLDRLDANPEFKKMIAFLESKTGREWETVIELT